MTDQFPNQSQSQIEFLNLQANTYGQDGDLWEEMWYLARMVIAAMCCVAIAFVCMYLMIKEQRNYEREVNCINAACEKPCEDIKRFKRHEGCK